MVAGCVFGTPRVIIETRLHFLDLFQFFLLHLNIFSTKFWTYIQGNFQDFVFYLLEIL